jgi:hypothetical protein
LDLAAAAGNKGVGDLAQELKVDPGTAQAILFHAVLGGLISSAKGEGFTSGAIAGGVAEGLTPKANEFLAQYVSEHFNANDLSLQGSQDKIATAQIIGLLSAALAGGNANTGSLIGGAGEKYNSELHKNQIKETDYELRKEIGEYIPQQEQDSLGKIEPIEIMQGPHGGASPLGTSLLGSGKLPVVGGSGTSGNVATEGAKGVGSVADDFFAGTKYTDKVLGQINTGDFHAFPEGVTAFQGAGQVTKITGRDGVVRDLLKIPGEYRGKQGVFEFIKESDGSINHRLFNPTSGQ